MSVLPYPAARWHALRESLAYQARVLQVIASTEFKLKYADNVLGYLWSLAKPLSYFAVIWLLLGGIFRVGIPIENYPLYLLLGIVVFTYFTDAVGVAMSSIVMRGGLLRRIYFPRLVIPLSLTATATITFCVNVIAVVAFIAISRITPELDWLLILPLLVELYVFILGLGLVLATLYVRFRDIAQIWELAAQLLFFAMPVMYSISFLPHHIQRIVLLNPVAQVMQDIRRLIMGDQMAGQTIAAVYLDPSARLLPMAIALGTLLLGLWLFQRESPDFAQRV